MRSLFTDSDDQVQDAGPTHVVENRDDELDAQRHFAAELFAGDDDQAQIWPASPAAAPRRRDPTPRSASNFI